ncbi:MAG: hypothetical protein JW819_04955 [Candidatus Krumholzibacteriota bacterium]|nr:hypothetical protein [Candidatus Krumholzibacteriota bacterium]
MKRRTEEHDSTRFRRLLEPEGPPRLSERAAAELDRRVGEALAARAPRPRRWVRPVLALAAAAALLLTLPHLARRGPERDGMSMELVNDEAFAAALEQWRERDVDLTEVLPDVDEDLFEWSDEHQDYLREGLSAFDAEQL